MILANSIEKQSVLFRVLTDDQVAEIKRASYDVMAKVGFKVLHDGARKMLKQAGCRVKDEHVKVPEHVVNACLDTTPKGYTIYSRDGRRAMEVEGRKSYYGTSTASPNTMDALTGEIHPTHVADIANGAKVADAMEHIDWVMPMGSAQDVPPTVADLYEFEAVVTNTTKPIVFIGYTPKGVELVYEMAAEVAGGLENLQDRPFLIFYPEPISPLVHPADVIDRIFVCADSESTPDAGPIHPVRGHGPGDAGRRNRPGYGRSAYVRGTGPTSESGMPLQHGMQFRRIRHVLRSFIPGVPRNESGPGSPSQKWRYPLGCPHGAWPDLPVPKLIDAQAGAESAFSILAQGLGGLNLIHDVGYIDNGMICSTAQLVLGNENIGMAKRFIRGIAVNQ